VLEQNLADAESRDARRVIVPSGLRAMPAGEVTSALPGTANCQNG
jgi:hypothetical protein